MTTNQPMRFLSFGAGVQSTTLLRMILAGEIEPVDHVIFADTGWEPRAVYEHLARMRTVCEDAGVPFHMVSNGNIRDDVLDPSKRFASMPLHVTGRDGKPPTMARRQCTENYKLRPLQKKVRELVGLEPGQRSKTLLAEMVIGISWDEVQRVKDPLYPWQRNNYPLVDRRITRNDCLRWNAEQGFQLPPRSSCIGCPYHSDKEWRNIASNPADWEDACQFDDAIRQVERFSVDKKLVLFEGRAFLHRSRIPLRDVDLRTEEELGQEVLFGEDYGFGEECEGMCGV